jgi:formate-dependent nitrite reductase membrane component NrfD
MNEPTLTIYADLEAVYRPQRVWAEGRAISLVLAHFLSGVGAGGWLMGLVLDQRLVLALSLGAIVLGGLVHLGFLGHPERAWKMMLRPQSSWISRGLWSMIVFVPTGALYLAGLYGAWDRGSGFSIVMLVLSLMGMAGIFLYKGFVYTAARAVALWHSPLLPVSYIALGVRGGAGLALAALAITAPGSASHAAQTWWLAATAAAAFFFMLEITMGRADATIARSLARLRQGSGAWVFYIGVVLIGLLVPAVLVIASYPVSIGTVGLLIAGITSLIGDAAYKYCMNSAGTYIPIIGV